MLTPSILTNELSKFIDQESIVFESFPANSIDVANRWSNAFDIYAKQVIPISTTSDAAKTQMYQTLLALNNTPTGASILSAAFLGYTTVLATGMLPLFVATPPPAPLNLTPVLS